MLKKILKIGLIVIVLLLVCLISFPFLFKGKIIAAVKTGINQNLKAKVDFTDVDLSIFRSFPKVSVQLENVSVAGTGAFAADTLAKIRKLDADLDIMSIIRGKEMNIYAVHVQEPTIYAIRLKDGSSNWDIVKADSTATDTTAATPFNMKLQQYTITNGKIGYSDDLVNMKAFVYNLNHEGSGDFTEDVFNLTTKTTADSIDVIYAGVPYLSKVKTGINLVLNVDNRVEKYSFTTDEVKLNELQLRVKGFVQMLANDAYAMDIAFDAPSTDFKNILSFIPQVYANNFASIKTSGKAIFNGFVKGTYSETQLPGYALNLDVSNGFFQYPDLPKPVKNINLTVKVTNPDGVTDNTVVDIPKGHIEFEDEPVDFRFLMKQPVSNMFIDAFAKGKIDLGKMGQFIKMPTGTSVSGIINSDLAVVGSVNAIQKQQYDKFSAKGTLAVNQLKYISPDYPTGILVNNMLMTFNPKNVTVSKLGGKYMSTNFSADGSINNLLPYLLKGQALDASVKVKADYLNLNEFMATAADTANASKPSDPFVVPANLNIKLDAAVGKVHYDNLDITNVAGSVVVADETVTMKNVKGEAMDGSMVINGSYSTKLDKKKPDIAMSYDLKNFNIQKSFYTFNTFQKLMPVGKFLSGRLSSKMSLQGKLGDNMIPELNSLTGNGNMFLLEGFLSKFTPLDKLSQTLNISSLQNISMRDIKGSFEVANGKILIKPFNLKVKDIDMEIGGFHGIDQTLDYTINMKVPRQLMGSRGNALIDNLAAKAGDKGMPLKVGDMVPLKVSVTGLLNNPNITTDLKQTATSLVQDMKDQVTTFVQNKVDSAKQTVKDSLQSAKNQAIQSAKDEILKGLTGKKDTTQQQDPKKRLEQTGRGLIDGLFKKKGADTATKQ